LLSLPLPFLRQPGNLVYDSRPLPFGNSLPAGDSVVVECQYSGSFFQFHSSAKWPVPTVTVFSRQIAENSHIIFMKPSQEAGCLYISAALSRWYQAGSKAEASCLEFCQQGMLEFDSAFRCSCSVAAQEILLHSAVFVHNQSIAHIDVAQINALQAANLAKIIVLTYQVCQLFVGISRRCCICSLTGHSITRTTQGRWNRQAGGNGKNARQQ